MLLSGLLLTGLGLLVLLFSHLSKEKLPQGIIRSRAIVLSVSQHDHTQRVKIQYFAGRETITFSIEAPQNRKFFAAQQVYVDYHQEDPHHPIQLLDTQEVMGRQFWWLIMGVLIVIAGVLLIRSAG